MAVDDDAPRVDGRTTRFAHRRPELLHAAAEYVLDNGLADLSLRRVAETLGVTHATVLRHFSAKDELILAVIEHIRGDFESRLASQLTSMPGDSAADVAREVWIRLCQPREQRQFRLLFELSGNRRLVDRRFTESMVQSWVTLIAERIIGVGSARGADARALATLMLAQFRGLQLDLLLTGDRVRVDAALEIFLRQFEVAPAGE